MASTEELEARVKRLERLVLQAIDKAERHPVGRKILAYLGLDLR